MLCFFNMSTLNNGDTEMAELVRQLIAEEEHDRQRVLEEYHPEFVDADDEGIEKLTPDYSFGID